MLFHTFLLVFIAEMADKTQLMIMALANRYRLTTIITGMMLGVFSISAISVLAGDFIGGVIPVGMIKLGAAAMFLIFGLSNLFMKEESQKQNKTEFRFPVLSIALTFLIAELGDKTQLATVAIAADHMDVHLQVFLGSSFGLILANIVGIFAGKLIFSKFSDATVKVVSSFIFLFFGSLTLFEAVPVSTSIIVGYSILLIITAYIIYTRSTKRLLMK